MSLTMSVYGVSKYRPCPPTRLYAASEACSAAAIASFFAVVVRSAMSSPRACATAASSRASDAACSAVHASATVHWMPWKSVTTLSPTCARAGVVAGPSSSERRPRPISSEALPSRLTLNVDRNVCSPLAGRAEPGGVGHPHLVELDVGGADQPQPDRARDVGADAGQRHVDEEAGQPLLGDRVEQRDVAVGAEVDVRLAAGQDPVAAVAHRGRLHRLERRAGVLLADATRRRRSRRWRCRAATAPSARRCPSRAASAGPARRSGPDTSPCRPTSSAITAYSATPPPSPPYSAGTSGPR